MIRIPAEEIRLGQSIVDFHGHVVGPLTKVEFGYDTGWFTCYDSKGQSYQCFLDEEVQIIGPGEN